MLTSRRRFIAGAGLAIIAALPLPQALANHVPIPPDHQFTETDFDVSHFSANSVNVDNTFLPVPPGTTFTLTGTANRGGGGNAHQVVFTVTEVTKVINGVRAQVLWDRDIQEGVLVEEELAFWAQDDFGNVWLMGEYPEEHEGNQVSAPSTWLAGVQEAAPGILMRRDPKLNTTQYKQGDAPSVEFLDLAKVFAVDQHTCVPVGCYDGVLVIDEWDPNNQPEDGHQFKYHAPGVGIVQVTARGGDEQETLVTTEHRTLTRAELDAANARTLELDTRAYTMAQAVYGASAPAVVRPLCPSTPPTTATTLEPAAAPAATTPTTKAPVTTATTLKPAATSPTTTPPTTASSTTTTTLPPVLCISPPTTTTTTTPPPPTTTKPTTTTTKPPTTTTPPR